uniref:EF-hand domain-containing protein n=1 Tax=viral metagenome TaxID=1070528 RepID=A0A6C0LU13_9ZZZZ
MSYLFDFMNTKISYLNDSKFFAGLVMIMLNIGSRYITIKFSKTQENYLKNVLSKQIFIFSVAWMGTRDIYLSLIITLIFVALADYAFNDESRFCMLPSSYKNFDHILDKDGDGNISDEELKKAHEMVARAEDEKRKKDQKKQILRFHSMTK